MKATVDSSTHRLVVRSHSCEVEAVAIALHRKEARFFLGAASCHLDLRAQILQVVLQDLQYM